MWQKLDTIIIIITANLVRIEDFYVVDMTDMNIHKHLVSNLTYSRTHWKFQTHNFLHAYNKPQKPTKQKTPTKQKKAPKPKN